MTLKFNIVNPVQKSRLQSHGGGLIFIWCFDGVGLARKGTPCWEQKRA